jgi:hypothetical protein
MALICIIRIRVPLGKSLAMTFDEIENPVPENALHIPW